MDRTAEVPTRDQALLNLVSEPVFIMDLSGRVLAESPAFASLVGGSALDSTVWAFVPAVDRLQVADLLHLALQGSRQSAVARLVRGDGGWVPVNLTCCLCGGAGDSPELAVAARSLEASTGDPDESRELDALRRLMAKLVRVNHDIRSPLGAIMGNAQLTQRALSEGQQDLHERLGRIVTLCERITGILDEITRAKQEISQTVPNFQATLKAYETQA